MKPARVPRLQLVVAAAWCILCLVMVWQAAKALDHRQIQMLWTYFGAMGPVILCLWLWAQANAWFAKNHISFEACFAEQDRKALPAPLDILQAAQVVTCIVAAGLAACALLSTTGSSIAPSLVPPIMYGTVLFLLILPLNKWRRSSRLFLVRTFLRVLVPVQPVSWADFILADVLTSLAKSSSDLSRSVCLMVHGPLAHHKHPNSSAATAACGPLTLITLAALAMPYLLRMVQCLSVWWLGGPTSQVFNSVKYASSLPALILSAMEHEHHVHKQVFPWKPTWLVCMVANSLYSFYWDVEYDWGMPWITQPGASKFGLLRFPALRTSYVYSRPWYLWLLASNLVLRFTWVHRLLGDLEAHNEVLMTVALLEVVRRWQWLFVRVEIELRRARLLKEATEQTGRETLTSSPTEEVLRL